jgi:hypothetical protein
MNATVRTPVVTCALAFLVWLGYAVTPSSIQAQLAKNPEAMQIQEPDLALDIDALLTEDRVLEDAVESNIWSLSPQPGRRLIQIPIVVTPKDQTTRLASPSIKARGGRFVAWRIIPDELDTSSGQAYSGGTQGTYRDQPLSVGSLRNVGIDDLGQLDNPNRQANTSTPDGTVDLGGQLSQETPVLARDLTVSPEGVIYWKLERAIAGAEIKSGTTGYFLKLRPDRLKELEPERPERNNARQSGGRASGQDAREAEAKRRTEELEFRTKALAYRELRDQVRKLPDEFQTRLPSRLWAVFEVSDRINELSFTGGPPMPWQIAMDDLISLRQVASQTQGGNDLTAEDFTAVSQMSLMLADEHPLTQQAVAGSMGAAQMFGKAQQGDALYRLIDSLLKSDDPQTVRAVTAGLASTTPPTASTLSLLRGALGQLDPASKLLALGGLLTTQDSDPIGQRQVIETANQMLTDPDGPGVVYILDQLARAMSDKPDGVTLVGGGIRFDSLDEASLDKAIVYSADAAGNSAVAAAWMEHGLLGSTNPAVVHRTVEVLGTSAPGGGPVSMLTKKVIQFSFGPANEDAANRAKPPLRGIASIPIGSAGHSIYRVLNAGDPEFRMLGWKALRHFQVYNNTAFREGVPPQTADTGDRMELILDAAFNETVTPPQLVLFLVNQKEPELATAALVRIVVEGRGPAITQAARALVRSGRQLEVPIQALTPEQRGTFAVRLYEAVTGSSPMVAGLMRVTEARSPLVNWFAQHVSASGLPESSDWAPAANGEDNLITLASSSDPELASAAVASLVASAGGDEQAARDLARQMGNATDRSVEGLREQWGAAKQELYTARLSHAAGQYRLIVNLRGSIDPTYDSMPDYGGYGGFEGMNFPTQDKPFDTAANAPLIKSHNVALIELQADGHSLGLASGTLSLGAADSILAISLTAPNELKDFGHKEIAKLPIEDIEGSIDLLPQKDGSWRGAAAFYDGRSIEVVFDPE